MTRFLALAAVCLLAGCASSPPTTALTTPQIIAKVQADWPIVKAAANVVLANVHTAPGTQIAIVKAEGIIDGEVAALSSVTAPTTVKADVADIAALEAGLPPGTLPQAQQADLTLLLAVLNAGVSALPAS